MYYAHFGFQRPPFSISPDPHFLYLSERHRDALAHLIYGAGENGGFVLLTGQVGTGKTTLIRSLLSQALPDIDIALCLHSGLSAIDFVATILDELSIEYAPNPTSLKPLIDALNVYLLEKHAVGRQTVLIIDEGQNLSREVLEQVRLLTNLETDSQKLLRIILVGQEELQDIINRADLRQLSQRITGRYHLTALDKNEVRDYVNHRVKTAGGNPACFTDAAIKKIYQYSQGVPRLINVLCDRALLVAYNADKYRVTRFHVGVAAAETLPNSPQNPHLSTSPRTQSPIKRRLLPVQSSPFNYAANAWAVLLSGILALVVLSTLAYFTLAHFSQGTATDATTNPQVSRETPAKTLPMNIAVDENKTQQIANTSATITPATTNPKPTLTVADTPTTTNPMAKALAESPKKNAPRNEPKNELEHESQFDSLDNQTPKKSLIARSVNQTEGVKLLLKRWSLATAMPANLTACDYASTQQMACLTGRASLPLIRTINRPTLLELKENETFVWLPIVGIQPSGTFQCLHNNQPTDCEAGEIANLWTGNYLALFRQPNVAVELRPGFEGEQIEWLRQRIAIAENKDLDNISGSLIFDDELAARVKQFQRNRNLDADGIIGEKTLLYLYNVVADETTPTLLLKE